MPAAAAQVDVGVTALGQAYALRQLGGTSAARLRNAELLRLNAFDLGGGAYFVSLWRVESDFGTYANDPIAANSVPRPDLCAGGCAYLGSAASASATLLYGYLELPDIAPRTTLRVGRQVSFDPTDLHAFDGVRAFVALP